MLQLADRGYLWPDGACGSGVTDMLERAVRQRDRDGRIAEQVGHPVLVAEMGVGASYVGEGRLPDW